MTTVHLVVNGIEEAIQAPPERTLLESLREDLKLFGTREACGIGLCGSCTVLLDGRAVSSCLFPAGLADGADVLTIEGLGSEADLHPVQQAFVDNNAFQCSYCTPGFILMTVSLLAEDPAPTREAVREYLSGNLCRCGSYIKIEDAVLDAASRGHPRDGVATTATTEG